LSLNHFLISTMVGDNTYCVIARNCVRGRTRHINP
jgi:hypothetical protein